MSHGTAAIVQLLCVVYQVCKVYLSKYGCLWEGWSLCLSGKGVACGCVAGPGSPVGLGTYAFYEVHVSVGRSRTDTAVFQKFAVVLKYVLGASCTKDSTFTFRWTKHF